MGHRLWLSAVAIHRLSVVEIAPSPHHCFRTAHPCAQSVKVSPTEPVLSRSSRQSLGHLQSHFHGGWHIFQAVFPEPQSADACRRVERRDGAHEALPRLQSASSWLVMEQLVSGVCRLSCAFHATGNSPPGVRRVYRSSILSGVVWPCILPMLDGSWNRNALHYPIPYTQRTCIRYVTPHDNAQLQVLF